MSSPGPISDAPSTVTLDAQERELDAALILEPVGDRLWRICDSRLSRGEGRFLGFVERKGDDFELMQLADDFVWTSFSSMRTALDHIVVTNAVVATAQGTGILSWIR